MKRLLIISLSVIMFGMGTFGCGEGDKKTVSDYSDDSASEIHTVADSNDINDGEEEDAVDAVNRTMIAEALGIDESSRNIRFIVNGLHTIEAGQLLSAEATEINGENVLNIVSEDGTNYCIYLTGSGSVDAIKNVDTGEWPVISQR